MAVTYGGGTATQFTDASQRQVLELGPKIHYYNPSMTPILSISGRGGSRVTPVPIFEWMEDEYMLKRSIVVDVDSSGSEIGNLATSGVNDTGSVLFLNRQAQVEAFELGGVYAASKTGGVNLQSMTHYMCVGIGESIDHASADHKTVQLVGFDASSTDSDGHTTVTYDQHLSTTAILSQASTAGTLKLEYIGQAQSGSLSSVIGYNATSSNLTNNDVFSVHALSGFKEGAGVSKESRKKVRRLKNCTQIFREPYTITRTARVSKQYGGPELARLQARKLAKIKVDVEWALLSQGAIALDASSENPRRTFQGFGVNASGAGSIKTNNGDTSTNLQLNYSSGTLDDMDAVVEYIFQDQLNGSMTKTVFASNKWMRKLVAMVRDNTSSVLNAMMGEDEKAGLRVTSFMGPVGQLDFISHPLLNGLYEDYAIAIDPSNFDVRALAQSDFQLRRDIVKDGSDGQTDEWLVEVGPEVRNEQTHAIMKLV